MNRLTYLVALIALLLAGCGGGGDDSTPPAAPCRSDFVGPMSDNDKRTCGHLNVNPRDCRTSGACL